MMGIMRMGDGEMVALAVRQPYVEQILRGSKRIEYRSRATARRGRVYLYASRTPGAAEAWEQVGMRPGNLPTGVVVGTVEITDCTRGVDGERHGEWEWHLARPKRLRRPLAPRRRANVTWFRPF
jgi:hypothetical protein